MVSITRRHLLGTAALAGSGGAVLTRTGRTQYDPSESGDASGSGGWRHPQATPGNTAAVDVSGPTSADSVDWQQSVRADQQLRFGGFARHDETLVVPTHRCLIGISTTGDRQFEATLSREQWTDRAAQIDSGPHIFGNRCFLAGGASVYALDVTDGRSRWRYDLNSSIDGLVVLGNTVYLSARVGSGQALIAVGLPSGDQRWRRDGRLVPLAADSDRLVVADYETRTLRGVDPASGSQLWHSDHRVRSPTLATGTVGVADDAIWHVQDGSLTAVDATTGGVRWTDPLAGDGSGRGDRFAVSDAVYVIEPDFDRLTAIELDGERRWSRALAGAGHGVAVGGDTVYAATRTGLEAVATGDGSTRFRVDPASSPGDAITPLVEAGGVYGLAGDTLFGVRES